MAQYLLIQICCESSFLKGACFDLTGTILVLQFNNFGTFIYLQNMKSVIFDQRMASESAINYKARFFGFGSTLIYFLFKFDSSRCRIKSCGTKAVSEFVNSVLFE